MLPFLALLCSFAVGQCVAWRNMLRGRFALGFVQFALVFFLADVLLVLHFIAGDDGSRWRIALWAFLLVCFLSAAEYLFHAIRGRRVKFREAQARQYGEAMDAFLRRQDADALRGFRRVCRRDPWDSAAALMVGTLEREGRDQRWLRRARARAEDPRLRDEIEEELRWRRETKRRTERMKAPRVQAEEPSSEPSANVPPLQAPSKASEEVLQPQAKQTPAAKNPSAKKAKGQKAKGQKVKGNKKAGDRSRRSAG